MGNRSSRYAYKLAGEQVGYSDYVYYRGGVTGIGVGG